LGAPDPYKTAVVDTIVAEVQGVPGDDRCVFLCGYVDQMSDFMRNANPGLKRRFQEDNKFLFEDYNNSQLYEILQLMASKRGVIVPEDAALAAINVLEMKRKMPNFGNGGEVASMLTSAVVKSQRRLEDRSAAERASNPVLTPSDFQPEEDAATAARRADPSSIFNDLIGCKAVIEQINRMRSVIEDAKEEGRDPLDDIGLNFKFVGPPGNFKKSFLFVYMFLKDILLSLSYVVFIRGQ
jgi:hypothetical protein